MECERIQSSIGRCNLLAGWSTLGIQEGQGIRWPLARFQERPRECIPGTKNTTASGGEQGNRLQFRSALAQEIAAGRPVGSHELRID